MNILSTIAEAHIFDSPVMRVFMGGAIVTCGVLMSISIVSYCMYDAHLKYDKNIDNKLKETEEDKKARELRNKKIKYGQSFFSELEELEDKELSKNEVAQLSNKTIEEETPEGDVLMLYSDASETYWYYSDNKNISNRTLDAVARRYAVKYDCKKLCVNYKKEMEDMRNKLQKLYSDNKDKKDDEAINRSDSVFLTKKITKKKIMKQHNLSILDKVNRFTFKGKLTDYKVEEKKKRDLADLKSNLISFSDFKNMMKKDLTKDLDIVKTDRNNIFIDSDYIIKKKEM